MIYFFDILHFFPPTVASLVGGLRATERVGKREKERERVRERG